MLAEEGRAADRRAKPLRVWLYERKATPAIRHLGGSTRGWIGRGDVRVTDTHLELLSDDRRHRSSRTTIRAVEREGLYLWIRRRRAHDWLIQFEDAGDAERIEAALLAATG